ncbi:hypothetical protein FNV43_RR14272 [Rhamnella rubrinervis]|uniref:Uncharacterized protein n=1 Tax=Rhamnella rubrinervis TaxID=2594499 RepID=A0A8K0H2P0_9ROSA|nr:hypothetical protein FNV43_RR14272 [Rhamnella rubrinervis]
MWKKSLISSASCHRDARVCCSVDRLVRILRGFLNTVVSDSKIEKLKAVWQGIRNAAKAVFSPIVVTCNHFANTKPRMERVQREHLEEYRRASRKAHFLDEGEEYCRHAEAITRITKENEDLQLLIELLDASSLDDEGLMVHNPEKKSGWPTRPQDMELDGQDRFGEKRREISRACKGRPTTFSLVTDKPAIVAKMGQPKFGHKGCKYWVRKRYNIQSLNPILSELALNTFKLGASVADGLLVVTVMIHAVGHISGALMNPAVTLPFAAVRHFPWKQIFRKLIELLVKGKGKPENPGNHIHQTIRVPEKRSPVVIKTLLENRRNIQFQSRVGFTIS